MIETHYITLDTLNLADTLNLEDIPPAITHSLVAILPHMDNLVTTHSLNLVDTHILNLVDTLSLGTLIQNLEVMSPPSQ